MPYTTKEQASHITRYIKQKSGKTPSESLQVTVPNEKHHKNIFLSSTPFEVPPKQSSSLFPELWISWNFLLPLRLSSAQTQKPQPVYIFIPHP